MRQNKKIKKMRDVEAGEFAVDSGMVMLIDPGYLFSHEDWQKVFQRAEELLKTGANDETAWTIAVAEGVQNLVGWNKRKPLKDLVAVVQMIGDCHRQIFFREIDSKSGSGEYIFPTCG